MPGYMCVASSVYTVVCLCVLFVCLFVCFFVSLFICSAVCVCAMVRSVFVLLAWLLASMSVYGCMGRVFNVVCGCLFACLFHYVYVCACYALVNC